MGVNDMQCVPDSLDTGTVIAAWLSPGTLDQLEPVLRRLLAGPQLFVRQADGRYRPKGCQLGLIQTFDLSDLHAPVLTHAGS